eukprot:GHVO01051597.1.p1 GENE.GHVO01051597.1~~GHVO01051597.1.p1  ORF type:complete len:665 (+),score=134.96 GHVO01051597.1:164-2158(+)
MSCLSPYLHRSNLGVPTSTGINTSVHPAENCPSGFDWIHHSPAYFVLQLVLSPSPTCPCPNIDRRIIQETHIPAVLDKSIPPYLRDMMGGMAYTYHDGSGDIPPHPVSKTIVLDHIRTDTCMYGLGDWEIQNINFSKDCLSYRYRLHIGTLSYDKNGNLKERDDTWMYLHLENAQEMGRGSAKLAVRTPNATIIFQVWKTPHDIINKIYTDYICIKCHTDPIVGDASLIPPSILSILGITETGQHLLSSLGLFTYIESLLNNIRDNSVTAIKNALCVLGHACSSDGGATYAISRHPPLLERVIQISRNRLPGHDLPPAVQSYGVLCMCMIPSTVVDSLAQWGWRGIYDYKVGSEPDAQTPAAPDIGGDSPPPDPPPLPLPYTYVYRGVDHSETSVISASVIGICLQPKSLCVSSVHSNRSHHDHCQWGKGASKAVTDIVSKSAETFSRYSVIDISNNPLLFQMLPISRESIYHHKYNTTKERGTRHTLTHIHTHSSLSPIPEHSNHVPGNPYPFTTRVRRSITAGMGTDDAPDSSAAILSDDPHRPHGKSMHESSRHLRWFDKFTDEHYDVLYIISSLPNAVLSKTEKLPEKLKTTKRLRPHLFQSVELWLRTRWLLRAYTFSLKCRLLLDDLFSSCMLSVDAMLHLDHIKKCVIRNIFRNQGL